MARNLARIVRIGDILPIPKADSIEVARVGGWSVVVQKKENFRPGDLAVYFEIDSFLPAGNPAWQSLVDADGRDFEGVYGHALRAVKLRGQASMGLLKHLDILPPELRGAEVGTNVSQVLSVRKYEKPLPAELLATALGYRPGLVPSTDQERIQNQEEELAAWLALPPEEAIIWEVTEKLEGEATGLSRLNNQVVVSSSQLCFKDLPNNPRWQMAHRFNLDSALASMGNVALQGELIGPGMEGNHYGLSQHEFYLYNVFLVDHGKPMDASARRELACALGMPHAPVVHERFVFDKTTTMQSLIAMADGPSALNPKKRREGLVFKAQNALNVSFKVVSEKYLLNEKL